MNRRLSLCIALWACWTFSLGASARTLELQTTQVTRADVAVSPDAEMLVFTILGHLFCLPKNGGDARQLTFGPFYDSEPVFSPDGSRIAFKSDRDGSDSNVFVLRLSDNQISQLTHESDVGSPVWSPDGQWIAYLRYFPSPRRARTSEVRRISASGGEPEVLAGPAKRIGSTFFLADGRLGWTFIEHDTESAEYVTRIETLASDRAIATLRSIPGFVDRVVPGPAGDGLYARRFLGYDHLWIKTAENLIFVPLHSGAAKELVPVESLGRFALSSDGEGLYAGDEGRIWKVSPRDGSREQIPFHASLKLEVQAVVGPIESDTGRRSNLRAILSPRLSPDGRTLVFSAAGFLWIQPVDRGKPERVSSGDAIESEPAFSPDGRQLAFVRTEDGQDSLQLLDLASRRARMLASAASISQLSWSADSRRLVAVIGSGVVDQAVTAIDITADTLKRLADASDYWNARPQLSADGRSLSYSFNVPGGVGNLYRVALDNHAQSEQITHLSRHLSDGQVSSDGKWLVFRHNREILKASFSNGSIADDDVKKISSDGGDTFALTADGAEVVYAVNARVWRQSLVGGARREIPVRMTLTPPIPRPLLLRGLRVLNSAAGEFSTETSLLVEKGRIAWIGNERDHELPAGTSVVDAGGRFAIPGLFDMHEHSVGANERAFIAYGITSLRDTGGPLAWLNAMEDRSEFTGEPTPRYFYAGEIFEGVNPIWGDAFLTIDDEQEARDCVRLFRSSGASFIKVYPSLTWRLQRAIAAEAQRLGLPVVGHGTNPEEIIKSVTMGFWSVEHTISPDRAYDDLLQMLSLGGTRWDPTTAVMGGGSELLRDEPERLKEPKFMALVPQRYVNFALSGSYNKAVSTLALRGAMDARLASVSRAHQLGVKLLVGTDAPNPEVFYGPSLHWELARFVEAGLSPLQALRLATESAAAAVGAHDLGVIEPGMLADIVLVQGNPLENIRNTESIWRVVKGGWLFDPEKLQAHRSGKASRP